MHRTISVDLSSSGSGLRFGLALLGILSITSGCSALLPKSKERVRAKWDSFAAAEAAYSRIIAYETTRDELAGLGFDPDTLPNIRDLDYLELMRARSARSRIPSS